MNYAISKYLCTIFFVLTHYNAQAMQNRNQSSPNGVIAYITSFFKNFSAPTFATHTPSATSSSHKNSRRGTATPANAVQTPKVPKSLQSPHGSYLRQFSKISVACPLTVTLKIGTQNCFIITEANQELVALVKAVVDANTLSITVPQHAKKMPNITATLICTTALHEVILNSTAHLKTDELVDLQSFTLYQHKSSCAEFSSLKIKNTVKIIQHAKSKGSIQYLEAHALETEQTGNATLKLLGGKTNTISSNAKNSSSLDAIALHAKNGEVEAHDSAIVSLWADTPKITAYGEPHVTYKAPKGTMVSRFGSSSASIDSIETENNDFDEKKYA